MRAPDTSAVEAESRTHVKGGRFTIATALPDVKVAWRISRRKEELR